MQNIQQQLFEAEIEKFARTIVIKNSDAALAINQNMLEQGYMVDTMHPETWKYYLNLAGRYHASNQKMTIVSLDTLDEIEFDIASLQIHLGTKREYTYGSIYYQELVAKYPDQELLIRGIINPVDLNKAIAAKDGEILYYDTRLIEPQETNLIPDLQKWIYDILKTWTVVGFKTTDELYHLGLWANIYGHIAAFIRSVRWENCHTIRAHSYHIWNYLESKGRLGKYRRYVNNRQAQWLYRNIRWVHSNAGLRKTFNALLDKILTERNIPLGEYDYAPDVSRIGEGALPLSSAVSGVSDTIANLNPTPKLIRRPLNMLDIVPTDPVLKTVQYISETQIPLARDNYTFLLENIQESEEALRTSPLGTLPIKTYQSDMIDTSQQKQYSFNDFLLNHWLYLAATDRYESNITVADPRTTELLSMNTKEAFLAFVYTWSKLNGLAVSKIPVFNAWMVRRPKAPVRKELKRLFRKGAIPDATLLALMADQPPIGTVISTEGFYTLIHKVWTTLDKHYKLVSYTEDYQVRAYVEAVVLAFYQKAGCDLSDYEDQTFAQYFADRGWDLDALNRTDLEIINKELWEKATGIDTQNLIQVKDIQAAMISLMERLGTYAVQYLRSINDEPAIVIHRPAVRLGNLKESQFAHIPVKCGITVLDVKSRMQSFTQVPQLPIGIYATHVETRQRHATTFVSPIQMECKVEDTVRVNVRGITPNLLNEHEFNRTLPPDLAY